MNIYKNRRISTVIRFCLLTLVSANLFASTSFAQPVSNNGWKPKALGGPPPSYRFQDQAVDQATDNFAPEPNGELSVQEALAQALLKNPELAVFSWEVRAANARILQAGLLPNPELGVEVENFGGSAARTGFRGAESTIALSQLVELGGKREKRTHVARLERDLAGWDYESKRLDIYATTAKAFMKTLAAQRRAGLREEQLGLAERILATVDERVKAGRASPLEQAKALVTLESSRVGAQRAARELQAARDRLAALWGGASASFTQVSGELAKYSILPPLSELLERVSENPDLARAEKEFELRRSNLALARANDIPDITFSAGFRRYEETDDGAFIAGISIPIPVYGVNTGGVLEAERRLSQQKYRRQAPAVDVAATLRETYAEAAALHSEILALKNTILPGAEKAFEAAQQGYRQGKFDFLDVLDAQRTFFEVRERNLDTLAAYHMATLDIERLTGAPLMNSPIPAENRDIQKDSEKNR